MDSTVEILEDNLEKILKGEGLEVREFDSVPEQVKPVTLRKSVCYIVGAVIFNSKVKMVIFFPCLLESVQCQFITDSPQLNVS